MEVNSIASTIPLCPQCMTRTTHLSIMQASNEPVAFCSLPNECLQQVFSDTILSKPDLCSLALVNRRLGCLVPASLYKEIVCYLDEKTYHDSVRTFVSRPKLGELVRSIILDCRTESRKENAQLLSAQTLAILNTAPSLQILRVQCSLGNIYYTPLLSLRKAVFSLNSLAARDMGKLMLLPNITEISLQFTPNWENRESDRRILGPLVGKSPLKRLYLMYGDGTEPPELLAIPKALEVFSLTGDWNKEQDCVSPKATYSLLVPTCKTLVDLNLEAWWGRGREAKGDGSSINFNRFPSLKHLKTDRLYCFPRDREDQFESRRGLYQRLPAALESLTVNHQ